MNVLEHYDQSVINLGEPATNDDENYYCDLTYNDSPFIIQTNQICYSFKEINDSICISLASQDYALWIESLYKYSIELIYNKSSEWFDEELSFSDIENSFLSPLKSNIQKGCYDINCSLDINNLIIIDNKGRIVNKTKLKNYKIVPTLHIKGIKFNSKNFMLDIVLKSIIALEEYNENTILDKNEKETKEETKEDTQQETQEETQEETQAETQAETQEEENDVEEDVEEDVEDEVEGEEEYQIENDNKMNDMTEVNLENFNSDEVYNISRNNDFANIYETIDRKIYEDLLEHLKITFMKKKIKVNIDLNELFEEDIESDTD